MKDVWKKYRPIDQIALSLSLFAMIALTVNKNHFLLPVQIE
jgi:hypothetical protein